MPTHERSISAKRLLENETASVTRLSEILGEEDEAEEFGFLVLVGDIRDVLKDYDVDYRDIVMIDNHVWVTFDKSTVTLRDVAIAAVALTMGTDPYYSLWEQDIYEEIEDEIWVGGFMADAG